MQKFVKEFTKGLITRVEKESVPQGGASEMLNWHFLGDHVELRRGQKRMNTTQVNGDGRISFVRVGRKYDGTQIPFYGYLRKLLYWNASTEESVEIGSDILPELASGEDLSATLYQSIAGAFLFISSPNSSVYKIPTANPGSAVDLLEDTYRGYIKSGQGRMFLWNRKDKFGGGDKTGIDVSTIDRDSLADYTLTTAEDVGTGDGSTVTFTGTLAFKAAAPKKTVHFPRFAAPIAALKTITAITQAASGIVTSTAHGFVVGDVVVFQDVVGMTQINKLVGVVTLVSDADHFAVDIDTSGFTAYSSGGSAGKSELFIDDRSGGLTGSLGGTGTINYATGAFSITFSTAPVNTGEVVADYYTEDATDQGVFDFNQGDGTSIADSLSFRQDDAGFTQGLGVIGATIYCLHTIATYALRLVSSSEMTNLPYRRKVGIPYFRAYCETGEGIYYVDVTDPKNPTVRILETSVYSSEVIPRSISDLLDLSSYEFDKAVLFEWGEYIALACRTQDETQNNRLFLFNRIWKSWELHSFRISDMDSYYGALIAGDSASSNMYKLFTGVADEDAVIENYITFSNDDLDKEGVKDVRRMMVAGLIAEDQELELSYSIDNAPFVVIRSIFGTGGYVDLSQRKVIGSTTLGQEQIGGGQSAEDAIFASPYEFEFLVGTDRFERIRFRAEAKNIGYVSISEYGYVDARDKGVRRPVKYQE